jgi:hypothetical protein
MYNKKVLIDALKNLGSAKAPAVKKDVVVGSNNPMLAFTMKKGGSTIDKKLSVKKSNIQGKGLFIDQPVKKGEIIGLAHVNNQATPVVGKYHNHSEENPTAVNVQQGNKRYLVAAVDLMPGTEITTNYRMQPDLEQPEDFQDGSQMTPQKDGYRTYSPFQNLPYIDVESDTIDTDNIVTDLKLVGNNGIIKNVKKNSGLHKIPGASVIREIPLKKKQLGGLTRFIPQAGRMLALPPAIITGANMAPVVSNSLRTISQKLPTNLLDQATRDLLSYPRLDILTGDSEFSIPEISQQLGNLDFKDFSDGWAARQAMMNMTAVPQWVPGKENFYTDSEVADLVNKEIEYRNAWNAFEEMNPENPAMSMFNAFIGDRSRDELFSNLFPNAYMPNFRSKFLSPEQTTFLNNAGLSNPTFTNEGVLNKSYLKGLTKGEDVLPRTYKQLLDATKANTWLNTADPKMVVMEFRGSLGLKMEDINNATPEQLEEWRQQVVTKMYNQAVERWKRDIDTPFKGSDAYNQLISIPGSRNQFGGSIDQLPLQKKGGSTPKLPKKKNSKAYSKSLEATNRLLAQHPFFAKSKSRKNKIYDPNAKYYQDGGASSPEEWEQEIRGIEGQIGNPADWTMNDYYLLQDKLNAYRDWRENTPEGQAVIDSHNEEGEYNIPLPEHLQDYTNAMMKSKLAYANAFGNPAAQRMINIPDNPYDFGNGITGTHYMSSMGNYAVPQIQNVNGQLVLGDYGPSSTEAMIFDNPNDARYFAEHYKDVSPGFIEAELTPEEIEEYAKGGYVIEDISVPSLNQAQLGGLTKSAKNLGRMVNIGTIGTVNSLAKTLAPVMIHPVKMLTMGIGYDGLGPFTGSPLNFLPFYGKDLSKYMNDAAFRKFGDTLDYVKLSGQLDPSAGPLLRMGKSQIKKEGNWAEPGVPNESYPGVFGARFDTRVPGSNLGYITLPRRNGVLITDAQGNRQPSIPISDPGLTFHRRLPFSNRYIDVNMDRLRNDQFDWRTMGGNLQSLIERYGYAALGAAGLGAIGYNVPQQYLDEYVAQPLIKGYKSAEELLLNPWKKQKGGLVKAQKGVITTGANLLRTVKPIQTATNTLPELTSLIKLTDFTKNFKPESLRIKFPLVLEGDSGIIQLTPNTKNLEDNLWHFGATMTNPIEAGKAMMMANTLFPYPKPSILEPHSLSLDSYNMLLNMGRRKDWDMVYENDIPLNWMHYHSDLAKGLNIPGINSVGIGLDDFTADQMVLRLNNYLASKGLTDIAYRIGVPGVSNMNRIYIPNYRLTRRYQTGGDLIKTADKTLEELQNDDFTGYELGDVVDKATKEQLTKLGYTFEKI